MDKTKAWNLAQERHRFNPKVKSVLSIDDLTPEQACRLVRLGLEMKSRPGDFSTCLQGKKVALLFQKTSTRTRCSFETGVYELGGFSSWIDWRSSNIPRAELGHEARVLSHYYHALMARVNQHQSLEVMARYSRVPVINGMSEREHPCQSLSDFMTLTEYFGADLRGLKLLFIGDAATNVCASLLKTAPYFGVEMAVSAPPAYLPAEEGGRVFDQPEEGARWADVIYTDAWVSIGLEAETKRRLHDLQDFQLNARILSCGNGHTLVMHCLPAHVGEEITADVIEHPQSIVFDQAENRSHAQKALLHLLLNEWQPG